MAGLACLQLAMSLAKAEVDGDRQAPVGTAVTSRLRLAVGAAGLAGTALLARNIAKHKRVTSERFELPEPPQPGTPEFAHLLEALTGAPLRPSNRVKVMCNGATLDAMVAAICQAKRTIDFSSYIYWPGPTADRFSAALAERAESGVVVNLLVDAYGSASSTVNTRTGCVGRAYMWPRTGRSAGTPCTRPTTACTGAC